MLYPLSYRGASVLHSNALVGSFQAVGGVERAGVFSRGIRACCPILFKGMVLSANRLRIATVGHVRHHAKAVGHVSLPAGTRL